MQYYELAADGVRQYLAENNYRHSVIAATERCFKKLGEYLEGEGVDYSPETASRWFDNYFYQIPATDRDHFHAALNRLQDIYEYNEIRRDHDPKHMRAYTVLCDDLKNSLDIFIRHLENTYAASTVKNHKGYCARFLVFAQKSGVRHISDITYNLMFSFYYADIYKGKWTKSHILSSVSIMMAFFYKRNEVPYGFAMLFHYLTHDNGEGSFWEDVSDAARKEIVRLSSVKNTITTDELAGYKEALVKLHADNEYSKTVVSTNNRAVDLLILFLETSGCRYSPEIAEIWYKEVQPHLKSQSFAIHRALLMVADYYHTSQMQLEKIYRLKPRAFDLIPDWCRGPAESYVLMKENEGWARSTLDMIRSSLCRFCNYLDRIGLRSFMELDASHIKQFNRDDIHKTTYGKNAYNTRIRKFLIYLGEQGYLQNPMLFVALTCKSAPKETVVVVLTEDEMEQLNEELGDDHNRLSLRKKAMLLLGLKMGMRASDIVNLKIDDIRWNTASIRFIQEKTSVEVNLPMPAEVGNALFRYIMEERRRKTVPDVFLSEKAPHKPVKQSVCNRALDTALPDRCVDGSGFHVTRKTYATNLLRNGVGAGMVAEALGQRGTASVNRYLSLDVDRMRMCALSLEDCGIGGWHDGR